MTTPSITLPSAMALAFAEAGASVIITDRTQGTLETTLAELRAHGVQANTACVDVGNPEACEAACKRIVDDMGPISMAPALSESTAPR